VATKKQKREAALAKREKFMLEERDRGLAAQQASHVADQRYQNEVDIALDEIRERYNKLLRAAGMPDA